MTYSLNPVYNHTTPSSHSSSSTNSIPSSAQCLLSVALAFLRKLAQLLTKLSNRKEQILNRHIFYVGEFRFPSTKPRQRPEVNVTRSVDGKRNGRVQHNEINIRIHNK